VAFWGLRLPRGLGLGLHASRATLRGVIAEAALTPESRGEGALQSNTSILVNAIQTAIPVPMIRASNFRPWGLATCRGFLERVQEMRPSGIKPTGNRARARGPPKPASQRLPQLRGARSCILMPPTCGHEPRPRTPATQQRLTRLCIPSPLTNPMLHLARLGRRVRPTQSAAMHRDAAKARHRPAHSRYTS